MSIVGTATGNANWLADKSATNHARFVTASGRIAEVFRGLSPRKTWTEVALRLKLCERSAKHRLAGTRYFSAEEIATLLRSEEGLSFLTALMADAKPRWWQLFQSHRALIDARRSQAVARRQLQEAIDADADLTAAIARADAFQDEDFHRPHADALRSARSLSRSTVATATKGRKRQ